MAYAMDNLHIASFFVEGSPRTKSNPINSMYDCCLFHQTPCVMCVQRSGLHGEGFGERAWRHVWFFRRTRYHTCYNYKLNV